MVTGPVGVLALQGDVEPHARTLRALGASVRMVRRCAELDGLAGLVLPGGESTAMLNLMGDEPWFDALRSFHARGHALLGTCAGAILLARRIVPEQASLGLLDAVVARNAHGRQRESFEAALDAGGPMAGVGGVFIRAPRFLETGTGVSVLGRLEGEPVAVREGKVVAATFHPELSGSLGLHRLFLEIAHQEGGGSAQRDRRPLGGLGGSEALSSVIADVPPQLNQ